MHVMSESNIESGGYHIVSASIKADLAVMVAANETVNKLLLSLKNSPLYSNRRRSSSIRRWVPFGTAKRRGCCSLGKRSEAEGVTHALTPYRRI